MKNKNLLKKCICIGLVLSMNSVFLAYAKETIDLVKIENTATVTENSQEQDNIIPDINAEETPEQPPEVINPEPEILPDDETNNEEKAELLENNLKISIENLLYGVVVNPQIIENLGGEVTFLYKGEAEADEAFTAEIPKNVGKYLVKATSAATDKYQSAVITMPFEILPTAPKLTLTNKSALFTGIAIEIDKAELKGEYDEVLETAVTYSYFADEKCEVSISVPTNEGTYYVKAKVEANGNYTAAESGIGVLTIYKTGGKIESIITQENLDKIFGKGSTIYAEETKTITLQNSVVLNDAITVPENMIVNINLNNFEIKAQNSNNAIIIGKLAAVNITGGKIFGGSGIVDAPTGGSGVVIESGNVKFKDVEIHGGNSINDERAGDAVSVENANVTFENTKVQGGNGGISETNGGRGGNAIYLEKGSLNLISGEFIGGNGGEGKNGNGGNGGIGVYYGKGKYKAAQVCVVKGGLGAVGTIKKGSDGEKFGKEYTSDIIIMDSKAFFTVDVTQTKGGTISPASVKMAKNETKIFTITPQKGYKISDVLINGNSIGPVSSYTVKNIKTQTLITAIFKTYTDMEETWENPFKDVSKNDYFYEAVKFLNIRNIMLGQKEDVFGPNQELSRATILTVLYRLENEPTVEPAPFDDVEIDEWYTKAIGWGYKEGIVDGVGNGLYLPDKAVTHEQLATILYRYAKYKGYNMKYSANIEDFKDFESVSDYAKIPLAWAYQNELITRADVTTIKPQNDGTRAIVAEVMYRFMMNVSNA